MGNKAMGIDLEKSGNRSVGIGGYGGRIIHVDVSG